MVTQFLAYLVLCVPFARRIVLVRFLEMLITLKTRITDIMYNPIVCVFTSCFSVPSSP